jgi:DNA-directed RNA polymerase subunit RPC12/RpoP
MNITKCDICKKEIKAYAEEISVSPLGKLSTFSFCADCGKPVMKFLEKNRLGEKVKNKYC